MYYLKLLKVYFNSFFLSYTQSTLRLTLRFSFFNKGEEEDLRYYYNVYIMYYIIERQEVSHDDDPRRTRRVSK